eukprot:9102579-Ditylum_brightwellii.AAC.1
MEIVNMVADGIQQALTLKDQGAPKENAINMIQDEDSSVQQQLTKMRNLLQTMQQQNVTHTPSPCPYYQPAVNAMSQQQPNMPPYPYNMYPPMPMWQQPLHNVTNTYQQQGGNWQKCGGGAKRKCQQHQKQYQ